MLIGLDGFSLLTPKTGVGHYTFELAAALSRLAPQHNFELIAPAAFPPDILEEINPLPNLRAVSIKTSLSKWALGLPRYIRRANLDLFHGTNYDVPLRNSGRNILTVHDLSVFNHTTTHEKRIAQRARRRLPIMLRAAARIITPTEAVKRELVDQFKVSPEVVVVTPEAPRNSFRPKTFEQTAAVRRRHGIEDNFILFVGTIEPRKNLLTLLRAWSLVLQNASRQTQLVIAGGKGWLTNQFDQALAEAQLGDRVKLIGYVGDEDLRSLYSACKVFVYPSLYEGFGLPPLEAMACGAPVVASRIDALVETLAPNAQFVDAGDEQTWALAIVRLLENESERERLSTAGLQHAARFSWEKTAKLTLTVYEQLAPAKISFH